MSTPNNLSAAATAYASDMLRKLEADMLYDGQVSYSKEEMTAVRNYADKFAKALISAAEAESLTETFAILQAQAEAAKKYLIDSDYDKRTQIKIPLYYDRNYVRSNSLGASMITTNFS